METLVREHGVNSFQMFMAYKDTMMLRDSELYQTLQTCKDIGAVARVHAENGELVAEGAKEALDLGISGPEGIEISRPEELESEATHRAVTIPNKEHVPLCTEHILSQQAHEVAWRVGVEAERRDDNVGGSMNPVLTVILLPVQHGVSHRGLCVDHLTCRDKQKTSVTRRQSALRRCHCQNLSEFKPLNRAPELPFLSISSFKSNFQTHISYP
uniref:dihydropyrimidinase-related protein 5-like n=1 Tax=Gasterosteus aculeatus aculeatus TaxID=481459 RepID=UPI001A98977A|nr:dihydropyrimidinase-related protein 5-like [Gasterosteus aculeatus aculeatus]